MPTWPSSGGWPASGNWPSSGGWPSTGNWPSSGTGFSGNFASLFPGAYQVVQTDKGFTYGGTMLATGTAPPVLTITGALTGAPVPIQVVPGVTGPLGTWTFQVSYDGGSTVAQVGTSSASPVPLVGAGTGLSVNFAAGNAAADNVWKATCAALADQSGNAKDYSQATATKQPIVTVGLNGKCGLLFDGVDDFLTSTLGAIGTTYDILAVARFLQFRSNNDTLVSGGSGTFAGTIFASAATTLSQYSGALVANSFAYSSTAVARFHAKFTNSVSDSLRVGTHATVSGQNSGGATDTIRKIAQANPGTQQGNIEVFAVIYTPPVTSTAFDNAVNSTGGYGVGAVLV